MAYTIRQIQKDRGAYGESVTYYPQDYVHHNGHIFASLAEQTGNEPVVTINEDYTYDTNDGWLLVAYDKSSSQVIFPPRIKVSCGTYDSGTTYYPQDMVYYEGSTFTSLVEQTGNDPSVVINTDLTYDCSDGWLLVAFVDSGEENLIPTVIQDEIDTKVDKPLVDGTAGQHLALVDPTTGETEWEDPPVIPTIDSELSTESENPVQNKVVTDRLNYLEEAIGTGGTGMVEIREDLEQEIADRTSADAALQTQITSNDTDIANLRQADYIHDNKLTNYNTRISSLESKMENNVVTITGNQTITGMKGFTQGANFGDRLFIDDPDAEYSDSGVTLRYTEDTGSGELTLGGPFDSIKVRNVADPEEDYDAATKGYVDSLDDNAVHKTGNETVAGDKSFTGEVYFHDRAYAKQSLVIGDDTQPGIKESTTRLGGLTLFNTFDSRVPLENVSTPINDYDAANKAYVDSVAGASVTVDSALDSTSTNPVQNAVITNALAAKADDSDVVHLSGNEVIAGVKTFTDFLGATFGLAVGSVEAATVILGNTIVQSTSEDAGTSIVPTATEDITVNLPAEAGTLALQSEVASKADDADVVHLTGNESIAGEKTFQESAIFQNGIYIGLSQEIMTDSDGNLAFSSPISADGNAIKDVGTPSDDTDAANKAYVDDGLGEKQGTISDLSTIRSGATAGATAIQPENVAVVGETLVFNYNS